MPSSHVVNGDNSVHSYSKHSIYQRQAEDVVREKIRKAIVEKLDVRNFSSTSNTICVADYGCAVGDNTFISMQHTLGAIKQKFYSQCPKSETPEFQVFLNDQVSNDFNALFTLIPQEKQYFVAGVPGSFHNQLFPKSSIHFAHTSCSLHWLSEMPEGLEDVDSPAYNKGRIHYAGCPDEVVRAYASQFDKDAEKFLKARADELVPGGMLVITMPGIRDGMPCIETPIGLMHDFMGSIFMDMAKEGLVSEADVDSFNLPIYSASPGEMLGLVERNGEFNIERLELADPTPRLDDPVDMEAWTLHVRAAMDGMFMNHFKIEVVDEMFERLIGKLDELSPLVESCKKDAAQLFVVLTRK
ncbi:S-adenosylmethionine-dependent methyltransferase [Tripterygium wilfordii]|uniref:S-adenosylmethionine-dependent methyltransferase n=1 Tax=Tripterygium wilfordii TaxID=458696 RepID=A0A7J7DVA8_TRIWF|nr:loganic acid O-methyltransferase-like [Tripterygium wilfordii]KAF5750094.1 S-adenosylmethionine-dependent methyltransferase [Tripterygium wilfordii]